MVALVPSGAPEGAPQLEVSDDQVEFWTAHGYTRVGGTKKSSTKKTTTSSKK